MSRTKVATIVADVAPVNTTEANDTPKASYSELEAQMAKLQEALAKHTEEGTNVLIERIDANFGDIENFTPEARLAAVKYFNKLMGVDLTPPPSPKATSQSWSGHSGKSRTIVPDSLYERISNDGLPPNTSSFFTLLLEGYSDGQIASAFGVNQPRVNGILNTKNYKEACASGQYPNHWLRAQDRK